MGNKNYTEEKYRICQLLGLPVGAEYNTIKYAYNKAKKNQLEEYYKNRLIEAWNAYCNSGDNISESNLSEDNLSKNNLNEEYLSESNLSEEYLGKNILNEEFLSENDLSESNLSNDKLSQNNPEKNAKTSNGKTAFWIKIIIGLIIAFWHANFLLTPVEDDKWSTLTLIMFAVMVFFSFCIPWAAVKWAKSKFIFIFLSIPIIGITIYVTLVLVFSIITGPFFLRRGLKDYILSKSMSN